MAIEKYNGVWYQWAWSVTNALTVNEDREYIQNPIFNYVGKYTTGGLTATATFDEFNNPNRINEYTAFYQSDITDNQSLIYMSDRQITGHYTNKKSDGSVFAIDTVITIPFTTTYPTSDYISTATTNIPIFLNADIQYYNIYTNPSRTLDERNEALKHAFNYSSGEVSPEGENFTITNMYTYGEWINDTQPSVNQIFYNNFRAKLVSGNLALYPIEGIDDNRLKYGIVNNATFYNMQYSTDGITWTDTDVFPYEYFYRKRINELGDFYYALTNSTDYIPIFEDEETAQGFIDGDVDITDASNWGEISDRYPTGNGTGILDDGSDYGHVLVTSFFSQQYIMNTAALAALANDLFDTTQGGIWEDIKKGLDMYGANPMDAVMGLTFWPFNANEIFQYKESAQYVWFGGYGWEPTAGVVNRILYPDAEYVIGTISIKKHFKSWRDYEPYTKLYVMLPYCGTYQLDLKRYSGKTVRVKYHFDTRTGQCLCMLQVPSDDGEGWVCNDYFNGQAGVQTPISLTDFAGYARSQIQTLLGGGGQAVNTFGEAAGAASNMAIGGASLVAGVAGAGISGAAIGARTTYGLAQNNINNFNVTKGGSTPMINQYLPQSVSFIFEIQEDCAPANYGDMFGYPSMSAGKINNFSGFLKCQAVKLECPTATERERERLKQMLLSGIYI